MNTAGRGLVWINYFQTIPTEPENPSNYGSNQQSQETRKYKGMWRADQRVFEGIGIIEYADGSVYMGMT